MSANNTILDNPDSVESARENLLEAVLEELNENGKTPLDVAVAVELLRRSVYRRVADGNQVNKSVLELAVSDTADLLEEGDL